VIDDDATMVSLLQTLLELDGYEVVTTHDWGDIPGTAKRANPDLVLLDYYLPGLEGIEVIAALREVQDLKDLRIIVTSGMNLEEECLRAGGNAFILKPYSPDTLLEIITEQLSGDGTR
jgi:CheY-like chemotaxis protein